MPKLPDATALGRPAVPQSQRTVLTYDAGVQAKAAESSLRGIAQSQEALYRAQQGVRETMQGLGKTVGEIGQKQKEKKDRIEVATAKTNFLKSNLQMMTELENDPDYATYLPRYLDSMGQQSEQILKGITDPEQRELAALEFGLDIERGKATLTSKAFEKNRDADLGHDQSLIDDMALIATNSKDSDAHNKAISRINEIYDNQVKNGYIKEIESVNKKREVARTIITERASALPAAEKIKLFAPKASYAANQIFGIGESKGVSASYMAKSNMLESGGNPNAQNPNSSASGAWQFLDDTAKQYGLDDPTDPVKAAEAMVRFTLDNKRVMSGKLGRQPSDPELYIGHQQGATGGAALLNNPGMNAIDVVAQFTKTRKEAEDKILLNGGTKDMSAGEFTSMWEKNYEKADPSGIKTITQYSATGSEYDKLPNSERTVLYEQGLKGLDDEKKNEAIARTFETQQFMDSIIPKMEEKNFTWSHLKPAELRQAQSMGLLETVMNYSGKTDPTVKASLYMLSPKELAGVDLNTPDFRFRMAPQDYQYWVSKQAKLSDPAVLVTAEKREGMVRDAFAKRGISIENSKNNEKNRAQFIRTNELIDLEVEAFSTKNNGRYPSAAEMLPIIDGAFLQKDQTPGSNWKPWNWGGTSEAPYKVDPTTFSKTELGQLDAALKAAGRPVTDAERTKLYLYQKYGSNDG